MKHIRYIEEFKKEVVRQGTQRGFSVSNVAKPLGGTTRIHRLTVVMHSQATSRFTVVVTQLVRLFYDSILLRTAFRRD